MTTHGNSDCGSSSFWAKMSVFLDLVNRKRVINHDVFISAQWQKAIFFDFLKIIVIRLKSEWNNVIYNLFEGLLIIFFEKNDEKIWWVSKLAIPLHRFSPQNGVEKATQKSSLTCLQQLT